MSLIRFNKRFTHLDVLCVKNYESFILAGIGSNLFAYSQNGTLLQSQQIFINERIHSICVRNNLILLKGGRELCLIKFKGTSTKWETVVVSEIQCCDWVQDVILLENQMVGLVTAHNFFEYWDFGLRNQLNGCSCEEKCILYSCKIMGCSYNTLVIFAGTVFGDVVIWAPTFEKDLILQRFKSHNGAVFSIEVNPDKKLLTTTSDDRSLKIWSIVSPTVPSYPKDWKNSSVQLLHALFGHTARVWKSLILNKNYVTIGEDSQLVVWRNDGTMIKTLSLHQESGIRALECSSDSIKTGGEDGGINAIVLKKLLSENEAVQILGSVYKVCYTQSKIVYCLNGVLGLLEEVLYESSHFSSYCVLEAFKEREYVAMGSIKGHLVVIDLKKKTVIIEDQILNGRVYSIHWLDHTLVTCGPKGWIDLWEVSEMSLKHKGRKLLPSCKERWTTCGVFYGEYVVFGDRMGNIHFYEVDGGENPVKSFPKIHSHLGVTDMLVIDGSLMSIGRDGTMKEFCDCKITKTHKLPLEWPWKLLKHKEDILILGFHSVSFIVWSMKHREIIASHNCSGGHRTCDYRINNNKLSFLYVKEKKGMVVDLILDETTRIRTGFHAKEINCLKILQTNPMIIVSGSEDTTLRFSKIENSELGQVEVLKSHISSIRAVCAQDTTIVSVGGRGQIIIWDFNVASFRCKELVNYRLMLENRYWNTTDPDIRIMCVDILKREDLLIAVGCSDCQIRIFSHGDELRLLCTFPYTHCVLNIAFLGSMVLVSMGTDGKVVFWDIKDLSDVKRLEEFPVHQSGINSFQFKEIESGKFILATGGDDNMISVAFVEVGAEVNLRTVWESKTTHSCQITGGCSYIQKIPLQVVELKLNKLTGIKIMGDFLLTTSIDQRITIWKWFWREDAFKMEFLHQHVTPVPDIQGMDAVWMNDFSILVTVYGKGIEVYTVDIIQKNK